MKYHVYSKCIGTGDCRGTYNWGQKKSTFGKTQLGGGGEKSRSPSSEKLFPIGFFEEKATNTIITTSASFGSFRHISCLFGYLSKKTDFQCHGFKNFQFVSPKNKKNHRVVFWKALYEYFLDT